MGLTSRKKRPLDRTIDHLRDTRLIIIATEGEKTEKQYFESELFGNRRVQVKVLQSEAGHSAPKHVLNRLKEFARDGDLQPDDQLWLVVDVDRWPIEQLAKTCGAAIRGHRNTCQLAISNPCFELWLYLHFAEWRNGSVSQRTIEQELRRLAGGYNKTNLDIDCYCGKVEDAMERAISIDTQRTGRWPDNPGTHVYRLVAAIRSLETGSR